MRRVTLLLCLFLFVQFGEGIAQSKKTKDNFSYAFGILIGNNLSEQLGLDYKQLDMKAFGQNLVAALSGKKTEEELSKASIDIQQSAQALIEAKGNGEKLANIDENISKNFGLFFGSGLKQQGYSADAFKVKDFSKAMKASMSNGKAKMTTEEAEEVVNAKSKELQDAVAKENLETGIKYLAEIAKKPNVKKTESGVYYEILTAGEGEIPSSKNTVTVHYHGTFIDGKVFDSSVDRGETIQFGVTQVIQGWQDILVLMPVGSKWRVYIPASLAYGEMGSPGAIPPNSTLIFDIELFDFE